MKVRIGVAAGAGVVSDRQAFLRLVDATDDLGYDSIWVPDIITTPTPDPIAALSVAAGRRERLKLGTHLILPGRDPIMVAKQLASLDQLSDGRLLLLAVLGLRRPEELAAQGVVAGDRPKMLEEMLQIVRTLWRGEELNFHGRHYDYEGVRLAVTPKQQPLEVWLGGQVPAALRRCGRLGEGWMPGLCTPAEAGPARVEVQQAAVEAGRVVDGEHFGVNISWVEDSIDHAVAAQVMSRRPDLDPNDVIAVGVDGLTHQIEQFLAVGFSKFVIRPASTPQDWASAVEDVAEVVKLQS